MISGYPNLEEFASRSVSGDLGSGSGGGGGGGIPGPRLLDMRRVARERFDELRTL